ncbi:MAG TPA: DUF1573 domain-containing protein [Candidatus Hydrogenedentes bacterium]|nr:DUF1573 domain-containing protein [Candidatus Hydrogenedentota bacterium]
MKIKASYVIIAVLLLLSVFILFAANQHSLSRYNNVTFDDGLSPPIDVSMEDAPKIRLEKDSFDFGVIPRDRTTTKSILIFNDGKSPLEIRSLLTSCGLCTRAAMADGKKRIPPGGSAELNITMLPSGVYGFYSKKTVSIGSNDPRHAKVNLEVEARVDPEFVLEPETMEFGTVEQGVEAEASQRFRSLIDQPLSVKEVAFYVENEKPPVCPPLDLSFKMVPEEEWRTPGRSEYIITARLNSAHSPGKFEDYFYIVTDLERFDAYRTPATGEVTAPFSIPMEHLNGGINIHYPEHQAELTIHCTEAFSVSMPDGESELLAGSFEPLAPDRWIARFSARADMPPGFNRSSVTLLIHTAAKTYRQCLPVFVSMPGAVR